MSDSTGLPTPYVSPRSHTSPVSQALLSPGTWWTTKGEWNGLPEGTYVLLEKVEFADGHAHTLHMAEPPSAVSDKRLKEANDYERGWRILAQDFPLSFAPATPEEATLARDAEIAAIQGRIGHDNAKMTTAQGDMLRIAAAAPQPLALSSPEAGEITPQARQEMTASAGQAMAARADAIRRVSSDIAAAAARVGLATTRVGLYYAERSRAAMASVQPALMVAQRLGEQVDTMGMYVGRDVDATLLVDGPSAAADEQLVILQRLLYLDEELLIHVESGGADFGDVASIAACMRDDPKLVERIFGAPRAVVAMKARRRDKQYHKEGEKVSLGEAMEAAGRNIANRATFLLVRDGQRVWVVDLPESMHGLSRMFPTPDDLEAPYTRRGWFREKPERIGPDDLGYAKATEEFRSLGVLYERVLLILWGLHDRMGLFGAFTSGQDNFLDPDFQQHRLRLVFDDQMLLGRNLPSYNKWLGARNRELRSGSRVAVSWRKLLNHQTAPSVVEEERTSGGYGEYFKAKPLHETGTVVVRREGDELVVDCPVQKEGWSRAADDFRVRQFNARVSLSKWTSHRSFGYLVLDNVDPDDIDYYLSARSEREHYLDYVATLVAARDTVRADLDQQREARDVLIQAVSQANLDAPEGGWPRVIGEAIRDWRAINRGIPLPVPGDGGWPRVRDVLLSALWVAAGQSDEDALADAAVTACSALGMTPLRLVRDGRNALVAYASPPEADVQRLRDVLGSWPYLTRFVLKPSKSGTVRIERSREVGVPGPAEEASERVIREFAVMPQAVSLRTGMTPLKLRDITNGLVELAHTRSVICMDDVDQEVVRAVLRMATRECRAGKSRYVRRTWLVQPAGVALERYYVDYDAPTRERVLMVGVCEDAWCWVARHADPQTRHLLESDVGASYAKPETHLEALPQFGSPPALREMTWEANVEEMGAIDRGDDILIGPEGMHAVYPSVSVFDVGKAPTEEPPATAWEMLRRSADKKVVDRSKTEGWIHAWFNPEIREHLEAMKLTSSATPPTPHVGGPMP